MKPRSMSPAVDTSLQQSYFDRKPARLLVCLAVMFLLAGLIRLKDIQATGVLVEREYVSAIFAHHFYIKDNPSVEPWRREIAEATTERQQSLEPPVTEYLVSLIYRIMGREELWYSRFLTGTFWLVGGLFFFMSARALLSNEAALIATGYYLFVPTAILTSRSFQPDALMMMLYMASLFYILNYFQQPSRRGLLTAAIVSGLTLLVRPLVLFAIFAAFISLSVYYKGSWKLVIDRPFIIFSGVAMLFVFVYYGYGILIEDFLRWKVNDSFRPFLLLRREFWKEWFLLGVNQAGYTALMAALLGFPMLSKKPGQYLAIGLGAAYVVFGIVFTFHIHTHGYYHIQLVPLIGLCAAPLVVSIAKTLQQTSRNWWIPALAALVFASYLGYRQVNEGLYGQVFESQTTAREVGELVKHSDRTVFVAYHYGLPLEYYGQLSGAFWPKSSTYWFYRQPGERELTVDERIQAFEFDPQYFVITNFNEYNRLHNDLQDYLVHNCRLLAQSDEYLIYDSCIY